MKSSTTLTILGILALAGVITAWLYISNQTEGPPTQTSSFVSQIKTAQDFQLYSAVTFDISGVPVYATIAQTNEQRMLGLSGQTGLNEGEGLFFVFPYDSRHGIWMKDMLFPIDILWFDREFRVVGITKSATPESFPEVFNSERDARYVLELNAGFVEANTVSLGDQVTITNFHIDGEEGSLLENKALDLLSESDEVSLNQAVDN